jgi:hypothetical protein
VTEEIASRRALRESSRTPLQRSWIIRWVLVGIAAALLFLVGWVGIRGLIAKNELESALPLVSDLKDDLKAVDLSGAQATVDIVAARTANARALTSDPLWRALELVPFAGPNLTGFRELAAVTDDIAQGVMVPVASLGDTLDPKALQPVDGRIDIAPFIAAGPVVANARQSLEMAYAEVQAIDTSGAIGAIQDAHGQLEGMLKPMMPLIEQADDLVAMLPTMLGVDGPRNYLLVFQNNSESRALGGHAGSWVQVTVDDGKIDLARQSTVHELKTGGVPVIALSQEQLGLWPGAGQDPSNVTMVPDLGLSAQTAAAFWSNRFGVQADAVVFIDPVALGFILDATGPVELPSGDKIDTKNAAEFLLNGVYLKYPLDADQNVVFESIADAVFGAVTGGSFDAKKLVEAALKSGEEHRLLVWFFDQNEQSAFDDLPFTLDKLAFTDKVADFGVYITDNLGSKMTYYVDAEVALGQRECEAGGVQYQVQLKLSNIVTPELGAVLPGHVGRHVGGALRILVTVYAPPGTQFITAQGWDPTFAPAIGPDGEYSVMVERLVLNPGQVVDANFIMVAPDDSLDRKLEAYVTPMARPIPVTDDAEFTC